MIAKQSFSWDGDSIGEERVGCCFESEYSRIYMVRAGSM